MSVCRPCEVRQKPVLARVKSVARPLGVRIMSVCRPCEVRQKPVLARVKSVARLS